MIGPIVFGAQRFVATSNLAVGADSVQSSVGSSMAWAEGDFSLISLDDDTIDEEAFNAAAGLNASLVTRLRRRLHRRLRSAPGTPPELLKLMNTWLTLVIALFITVLIQVGIVIAWRHYVNRKYYRQRATKNEDAEPEKKKKKPPGFMPFPSVVAARLALRIAYHHARVL